MKILTNTRHWKQNAFGVVEIKHNPDKDLLRANLLFITKIQSHAVALSNAPGSNCVIVPTDSNCSTPEQIVDNAVKIWQTTRQNREDAIQ